MGRVTLARAWNPGVKHYAPGDEVEVDEVTEGWLRRTGAVATPRRKPTTKTPKATAPAPEVTAEVEPTESENRPPRSASLDTWRQFAEKVGVKTKGLSKQDLIAATK